MGIIRFVKIDSVDPVVEMLVDKISAHLQAGRRVFWLVPGGSALKIVTEVGSRLQKLNLSNLTVTLTDERYGSVGHADSNWMQLMRLGFNMPGANLHSVLSGTSLSKTATNFAKFIDENLSSSSYKLGFFGIGPDGHTAGILPSSSATEADGFAFGYDGGKYMRLTITPKVFPMLDEAIVYAVGNDKHEVIEQLSQSIPINIQPAQLIKQVPKVTIFNDILGGVH